MRNANIYGNFLASRKHPAMSTLDITKLLTPSEQTLFEGLAQKMGFTPVQLAEIAIKKELYAQSGEILAKEPRRGRKKKAA